MTPTPTVAEDEHGSGGSVSAAQVKTESSLHPPALPVDTTRPWHSIMGHLGTTKGTKLLASRTVKGTGLTKASLLDCNCDICALAKAAKKSFGTRSFNKLSTVPGGSLHVDLASVSIPTLGGKKYFLGIVDEFSGKAWAILLDLKSDTAQELIVFFTRFHGRTGRWPSVLRSDNGGEFTSSVLTEFCAEKNITQSFSPPYIPQHNGRAERNNRTQGDKARCMLLQANAHPGLWGEALLTAAHIHSRTHIPTGQTRTADQLFYGIEGVSDLGNEHPWGCDAYVKLHQVQIDHRFSPVAAKGMYIGPSGGGAYKFIFADNPLTVLTTKHASFREREFTVSAEIRRLLSHTDDAEEISDKEHYSFLTDDNELRFVQELSRTEAEAKNSSTPSPSPTDKQIRTDQSSSQLGKSKKKNGKKAAPNPLGNRRSERESIPTTRYGMVHSNDIGQALGADVVVSLDSAEEAAIAEHIFTAILAARVKRNIRPDEPAEIRQKNKEAADENIELDEDRPLCNKNGEIVTPSQRCVANTKTGNQCGARTTHGCLCWQHLKRELSVRIKKSHVAGKGLFAERDFAKDERVVNYTGDICIGEQDEDHGGSSYVIELSKNATIDAARRNSGPGRMANDPKGSGKTANLVWVINNANKTVRLQALRRIKAGEELLISYGKSYFQTANERERRRQLKRAPSAIASALASKLESTREPLNVKEALSGEFGDPAKWKEAIAAEMQSMIKMGVFREATAKTLPPGQNLLRTKYVFKRKKNSDGSIAKYKARLVALGHLQVYGRDYKETFSPVLGMTSLRILLALVAALDLECTMLDYDTAYLNAELDRRIFLKIPEGCDFPSYVIALELGKALYGLHQSGRLWNELIVSVLKLLGYEPNKHGDECVLKRRSKTGRLLIIGLYVDDQINIFHKDDSAEMAEDIEKLKKQYKLKELGNIELILGMHVVRDRQAGTLTLDLETYTKSICAEFGFSESKVQAVPESAWEQKLKESKVTHTAPLGNEIKKGCQTFTEENKSDEITLNNILPAIGALMWIANCTRPDIAHTVNRLAGEVNKATEITLKEIRRCFEYIRTTAHLGITYHRLPQGSEDATPILSMYSDSDWAGCIETRRSTSGILAMMSGAAVQWKSNRQSTVAMSSTEAEYIAGAEAAMLIIGLRNLLKEVGAEQLNPTPLFIDNETAIRMSTEENYGGRRKHIDVKHHKLRELNGTILKTSWVSTTDQLADLLTKAMGQRPFDGLRDAVLGRVEIRNRE